MTTFSTTILYISFIYISDTLCMDFSITLLLSMVNKEFVRLNVTKSHTKAFVLSIHK